jgi:hypothetical protein
MKTILAFVLAAASLVLFNGCATSSNNSATAGAAVYSGGELSDMLMVSLMDARVAALAGAHDLQLTVMDDTQTPAHANISVRTATNTNIDIILVKQARNLTGIRIRAGASGDEPLSRELLEKIKAHL